MKLILSYILVIIFSFVEAISNDIEFEITPLTNNFNGSVNFLDKTIIYSSNSTILWSSDKGQTWNKKIIIDETKSIRYMKQCDSLLVGLMYDKYMVTSKDGINWEKIPLASNEPLISFDYYDGKYYILTYNSIQVYSGQTLLDTIPMNGTHINCDLTVNDKRIMISSGYYSIVSWDTKTLAFRDSINVTSAKSNYGLQFLKKIDNNLFCLCHKTLYRSSDSGDSWTAVADSLMNYCVYNNDIYRVWASNDQYFNNQTSFSFDKLGTDSKWNNLSVTKYDRMAQDLYFQNIILIDSLHIVITGAFSHLSVSSDGGRSWELKSLLYTNGKAKWFNSDTGVCIAGKATVYRTTNGGITWLPNKITDSYIKYFAENKFGMTSTAYLDLDSSGLVFATYPIDDSYSTKVNILKSTDFGDSFEAIIDTNLNAAHSLFNTSVKWYGNRTIAFKDKDFSYNIATFDSNLNSLWNNTNIKKEIYGLYYFAGKHYAVGSELVTEINGIDTLENEIFSLMESSDTCRTWQETAKLFSIQRKEGYFTPSLSSNLFNGHLIILAQEHIAPIGKPDLNMWTVYEYNMPNGEKLNECVIDSNYNYVGCPFVTFNDYNFLFGHSLVLYHKVSDPFCQWETVPWTKSSEFIYHSTIGDYLYGLLNSSLVKMTLKSLVSAIEEQEKINAKGAYLYVYPPYPLPSKNKVKISIYHDMSMPIEAAKINVYNSNGDKVAGKESITFIEAGQTHSIIEWSCQGMPPGVYLICINHNNTMKTVKAVVN